MSRYLTPSLWTGKQAWYTCIWRIEFSLARSARAGEHHRYRCIQEILVVTRAREEEKSDETLRMSFLRKTFLEVPKRASFFAFQYTFAVRFFGHSVYYMASNVEYLLSPF